MTLGRPWERSSFSRQSFVRRVIAPNGAPTKADNSIVNTLFHMGKTHIYAQSRFYA